MKVYLVETLHEKVKEELVSSFELTTNKKEAEVVITRNIVINKEFMDKCPLLKCIAVHGTGIDGVDLIEAKKRNIVVFNAPKQNCLSVAELNVSLILSISRRLDRGFIDTKYNGVNEDYSYYLGNEISNKTVGFIGIGEISSLSAKILKNGFNMRTIGYNRTRKNLSFIEEMSLEEVLSQSDYIVLGLSLNEETKGFIDLKKLSLCKKNAYLINATRGAIVNHDDLVYALHNNIIKGYASDVFEIEPVDKNDPLFKENVIATPHIGSNTQEALYKVGHLLYIQLIDYKNGATIKHRIV